MKVEIKIEPDITEPLLVLYTPKLTPDVETLIEVIQTASGQARVITAKKDNKTFVFDSGNIELIRTEGGTTVLYNRQAQSFKVDKPLHEVQERLGNDFIRISKSSIVNIYRVDHVSTSFNGTMDIVMKSGLNDYISRRYLADFKKRLGL